MVGGFAIAYDLVASSHGYTDEQIGNLPLVRFRQMTAAIQLRQLARRREEVSLVSWQTRMIAQYIAGGYMIDKGKPNDALKGSTKLGYDDMERALVGGTQVGRPKENKMGSFERLMGWGADGMTKRN